MGLSIAGAVTRAGAITRVNALYAANSVRNTARRGGGFGASALARPAAQPQTALFDQFVSQSDELMSDNPFQQNQDHSHSQSQPQSDLFSNANTPNVFSNADDALIERTLRMLGLTERDQVRVFVIPRGMRGRRGLQPGSFIHRPTRNRQTDRISRSIRRVTNQIRERELGNSERNRNERNDRFERTTRFGMPVSSENTRLGRAESDRDRNRNSINNNNRSEQSSEQNAARELRLLRLRLAEYRRQLAREQQRLANGPRRGWIVVERDE